MARKSLILLLGGILMFSFLTGCKKKILDDGIIGQDPTGMTVAEDAVKELITPYIEEFLVKIGVA